jgi:glutamate:GABA antiporter
MHAIQSEDPLEQETADPDDLVYGVETAAAVQERRKLRRSVGRADTALLMLAAIVVLDTLGAVSSYGAQAFTWLIVMVKALQTVFVVYGGHVTSSGAVLTGTGKVLADIAALGVILGLLSSGVVWLIGSDRAKAVAGYDGAAPRVLGYFSKRLGTPIGVNLLSGVVSTIVLILALTLTSGNAAKYFSATLGIVISMVTVTYVLIFPAVIKLRYSYPDVPRPYRIPGGTVGLWVVGILTTAWAAFTTIAIIYPGIGTAHPEASLPSGFTGERISYTLSQVIPLGLMVLVGLLFYVLGRSTRRQAPQADAVPADAVSADATAAEATQTEIAKE